MGKTAIEWTQYTIQSQSWACREISPGCANCYAHTLATKRGLDFHASPQWNPKFFLALQRIPRGKVVFVNSMSDTYHEQSRVEWIHWLHNAAAYLRPDLTFLVLTKRVERAYALREQLAWPPNLWLGASVENEDYLWRLEYLLEIPAVGHFVSAEPLLGRLKGLNRFLHGRMDYFAGGYGYYHQFYDDEVRWLPMRDHRLDWVIVGAESGQNRRPFDKTWAAEIRDMCQEAGVPFMFKQGGAYRSGQDRLLEGREWNENPFHLQKDHWQSEDKPTTIVPVKAEVEQLRLF